MSALDILEAAAGHMKDRAATYDKPAGERSMGATVAAFKAITGISMTEEQGWLFMGVLKQVRTQQGGWRADNYEDGAAYFALQGEAAERDRGRAAGDDFNEQRMDAIGQNGNDGLHYTEDMTDPRNWRAGDWVEFTDDRFDAFKKGHLYRVRETTTALGGLGIVRDEFGSTTNGMGHKFFRFHARPDAEGWIKHDGRDESPVGDAVRVDVQTEHTGDTNRSAGNTVWSLVRRYRPHLATKHDEG